MGNKAPYVLFYLCLCSVPQRHGMLYSSPKGMHFPFCLYLWLLWPLRFWNDLSLSFFLANLHLSITEHFWLKHHSSISLSWLLPSPNGKGGLPTLGRLSWRNEWVGMTLIKLWMISSSSSKITESLSAIFYPASSFWHPETSLPIFLPYQYLLFEEELVLVFCTWVWICLHWGTVELMNFWENTKGPGTMFVLSVKTPVKSKWVGTCDD